MGVNGVDANRKISYKRHRFPLQIIAHVVWLYTRFNLSLREVDELLLEGGVDVSYETIRCWTIKFGPVIAHVLRRRQPRHGNVWRLEEVVVKIAGRSYWLWRAVDQNGVVLEEILQLKRDRRAAKQLLIKLIKRHGFIPKRIITPSRDIAEQCTVGQRTSCDPMAPSSVRSRLALIIGPTRGSIIAPPLIDCTQSPADQRKTAIYQFENENE